MTEEKEAIYIDGVNVAGCEYFEQEFTRFNLNGDPYTDYNGCEIFTAYEVLKNYCNDNPNCLYKQLMFANKKLEAAKTETEKLVSTIWIMSGEITDLRNEKERLHNELVEAKGEQLGTLIRYNKILEGIKEIVKPIKENSCFGMNCGAIDWILDEINEVLK